jgi:hypothetical protein
MRMLPGSTAFAEPSSFTAHDPSDDDQAARRMYEQAIATLSPLVAENLSSRFLLRHLQDAYSDLASTLECLGVRELAAEAARNAEKLIPPRF